MSSGSFHGVAFNPYESQLIVTANAYEGVVLYDLRRPEVYDHFLFIRSRWECFFSILLAASMFLWGKSKGAEEVCF